MGLLVNGKWVDEWYDTAATGGRFMRTRALKGLERMIDVSIVKPLHG